MRNDYQDERDRYIKTVRDMQQRERETGEPARFYDARKIFNEKRLARYNSEIRPLINRRSFHV